MPALIPVAALLFQLASATSGPGPVPDTGAIRMAAPTDSVAASLPVPAVAPNGPLEPTADPRIPLVAFPVDTPVTRRAIAVEYSDWYARRLTIHRYASYAILPLFAAEYSLGQNLINDSHISPWMRPTHAAVAAGVTGLFALNTVTGVWNLWDARHDPEGRTLRVLHSAVMLASDAGFALTAVDGYRASHRGGSRTQHRTVAITSMGIATVGTAMMWLFNR